MTSILYVGDVRPGTTSRGRRDALTALGEDVTTVGLDSDGAPASGRSLLDRVRFRLGFPPDPTSVNERVLEVAATTRPSIVWVDSLRLVRRSTLAALRRSAPSAVLVGFLVDDAFSTLGGRGWRTFRRAASSYDVVFVPRPQSVAELTAIGVRRVVRFSWGFDPTMHRPLGTPRDGWAGEVFFAGHWEPVREAALAALVDAGVPLRVWGHADWRRGPRWATLSRVFTDGGVYGDDYARALSSCKIALCFYSRWNRDVQNTRMYEIPACGAFMLAERTAENVDAFREGVEAEYFDDAAELVDKTRWYLAHDAEREAIARRGRARCLESGYSYPERLADLLRTVRDGAARGR